MAAASSIFLPNAYRPLSPPLDQVPAIKAELSLQFAGKDDRINAGWPAYEAALRKAGVMVTNGYNPRIAEFYGLADCYVFPTTITVGSIDVPLSILEAMACNLPVVSTRFGGLPRMFGEEKGFFYSDTANFCTKIRALKEGNIDICTRRLVRPYSWDNIANNLYAIYEDLLEA